MARRKRKSNDRLQIEYVDVVDITPYENNPRDNEQAIASVAKSIQDFGFLVPVVLDENNVVIAGHTRVEASKSLGLNEVPTIRVDNLSEAQVKAFRLIDNKVSELARWDFDMLSDEINQLHNSGIEFTEFGWSQEEIDCLTDIVADDCLTNANIDNIEAESRTRRAERRAPSQTRFVLGEFTFFIPSEAYRRWAGQVRNENDYSEEGITQALKDALGITPYLDN